MATKEQKYRITQQGDTVQNGVIEAVVDYIADVTSLPTSWEAGSSCLVIEDSSVWMLGLDGAWHEI